jgi:hypothetical protein
MKTTWFRYCSALLIFLCVAPSFAQDRSAPSREVRGLAELREEPRTKMMQSTDVFFRDLKVNPDRSANDLGWDCLAATALLKQGNEGVRKNVVSIADQMKNAVVRSASTSKPIGWPASIDDKRCPNGGYDAFGDNTCNTPETTYAFQSGLGIACLAKASTALRDPALLQIAKDVFSHWQSQTLQKNLCDKCIYFATSDSANDDERYVRNMNVFMAYAAAVLGAETHEAGPKKIAALAMQSDIVERKGNNRGYLGKLDPQWHLKASEADRIENHSAAIAVLSLEIGKLLGSQSITAHGRTVWRDWATCDNDRCRKAGCQYWAGNAGECQATHTAAHCAFRSGNDVADAQCTQYLRSTKRVSSFGIWSSLLGNAPP